MRLIVCSVSMSSSPVVVAILSDGASRLSVRFGLMSHREVTALLHDHGPDELITRTGAARQPIQPGADGHEAKVATTRPLHIAASFAAGGQLAQSTDGYIRWAR
jgi:hypothetical protein